MSFWLVLDERYVYYVLFPSISSLPLYLCTDPYRILHPPNYALAESNAQRPHTSSFKCRSGILDLTGEKIITIVEGWDG